jgi:hypothetical protein
LFVEETMNGRILMGNNNETFWSYEEPVDEKHVAIMGWSRYYLTSPLNSK